MLLNPCQLSTRDFVVSFGKPLMFAEASTLGFRAGEVPGGQLYDDACDEGITLISHRSGARSHWYRTAAVIECGEVISWVYKPAPETVRKHPKLADWEVQILND